ncbi:MAG: glycosyltransferase family 2 protein [bacterium]|nr:glycosyltransferase family 2 protein [bacterium]
MNAPSTAPKVAVVILTWNRVDELVPCLESFAVLDYPNFQVVVLDNGSEDETVATTRAQFPWVTLIENGENLGFCRGNNVGLEWALKQPDIDYVMLLNSDTLCTPTLVTELVRAMQSDPRIGVGGAKNLLMENPEYTWGKYGTVTWGPMLVKTIGRFVPDDKLEAAPLDVDWVIGNACMMSRESLQKVGLFDEFFWQCNEDVDWCYRARAAGYRVVYVDRAKILHKGGSSADLTQKKVFSYGYFIGRNAFTFAKKHGTFAQQAFLFTTMWAGVIGRITFFTLDNAKHAILGQRAFVRGMVDGMRGRLTPSEITVQWPPPMKRNLSQGLKARIKRWLGV